MDPDKNTAIKILRSGFGKALFDVAISYTAPIIFAPPGPLTAGTVASGTLFFVKPTDVPLAVTAAHVVRGYQTMKRDDDRVFCQVSDLRFDIEDRLIDLDDGLDIATFRVTEDEVARLGKVLHAAPRWPPDPPQLGRGVFFAGYRAADRSIKGPHALEFGIYATLLTASEVGARHIACRFDWEFIVDITGHGLPKPGHPLHSLSGAPIWTLTQNAAMAWRLGGVIFQVHQDSGTVIARRPDHIAADGRLNR